jgi:hypothetical protein
MNCLREKKQRFDLILLGYSMNEILQNSELNERVDWMKQILGMLSTSGSVLVVEPAEKEVCNNLHETTAFFLRKKRMYSSMLLISTVHRVHSFLKELIITVMK